MLLKTPQKLIEIISQHLVQNYLPDRMKGKNRRELNNKDLVFFAKGIAELSLAFTAERSMLPKNYLNHKEYRTAYILYFLISNFLKTQFCLDCCYKDVTNNIDEMNILDIGCGPGTSLLASIDYFERKFSRIDPKHESTRINLTGIDQNRATLKDAASLIKQFGGDNVCFKPIEAHTNSRNIGHFLKGSRYEIIFLSNFLNEFGATDEQERFISELFHNFSTPSGKIILIEPALRFTTRALMRLRDSILSSNEDINVLAPCLHRSSCPMLVVNKRDWCHMYLNWERPPIIEKLDKLVGLKKDYLKFSYLILSSKDERRTTNNEIWRVVSSPLRSKGKIELLICNATGLKRLMRQDKDRSEQNAILDNLTRGDLIECGGLLKLGKDDCIKKIES